jgi:hypothetical protein
MSDLADPVTWTTPEPASHLHIVDCHFDTAPGVL